MENKLQEKNLNQLFPHQLYQQKEKLNQQQLLDENKHDQHLNITKLEQQKLALKIGEDTVFDTPVDKFGAKILSGLGWKEGFGIGKDANQSSAPIEYIPRQHRLGLGAKALTADQVQNKRQLTVTENYEQSSIGKNIKRVGEELILKKEMAIGSKVLIVAGTHEGLVGEVIAMKKQSALAQEDNTELYVSVCLQKSGATVQIKRKRLQLQRDRSRSPEVVKQQIQKVDQGISRKPLVWVHDGILARCVSKSYQGGTLYGKEIQIAAVLSEYAFEAKLDKKIYSDLRERDLETVLPTSKQLQNNIRVDVIVVRGSNKGKHAKVLQIDKKRDIVEIQIDYVQVLQVSQDDISCIF